MKEFETTMSIGFGVATILFIIVLAIKVIRYFRTESEFISVTKAGSFHFIQKFIIALSVVVFYIGMIRHAFVLQRGSFLTPEAFKIAFAGSFTALLLWELYYFWRVKQVSRWKAVVGIIYSIPFLLLGIITWLNYEQAKKFPAAEDSVILALPFKGEWVATGAGATGLTNHHDRIPSQKFAIDFARAGQNGKLFRNEGLTSQDSHTWGAMVISPVSGTVILALDTLEDDNSKEYLAGNHVIIQAADTVYVALAHFMQNSLQVKEGDFLNVGDTIAQVGNSGNSDFPHLHIHVQTTPEYDLHATRTLPFRFTEFKRKRFLSWRTVRDGYLLGNDRVKSN
jgi:hypothetical protein